MDWHKNWHVLTDIPAYLATKGPRCEECNFYLHYGPKTCVAAEPEKEEVKESPPAPTTANGGGGKAATAIASQPEGVASAEIQSPTQPTAEPGAQKEAEAEAVKATAPVDEKPAAAEPAVEVPAAELPKIEAAEAKAAAKSPGAEVKIATESEEKPVDTPQSAQEAVPPAAPPANSTTVCFCPGMK